ncbi:MAG: YicC family protein [Gammaproteobacteria bacterium]|nr:MAG: YicC family protein [Gammaproteobacteria bacterium]
MVASMTAFARAGGEGEWGTATWELRSVNHRFLEISLRLPEELRPLEPEVRGRLTAALHRGKVDATLRFAPAAGRRPIELDAAACEQLHQALREVEGLLTNPAPISALEFLQWPGVIRGQELPLDELRADLLQILDRALAELVASRQREGAHLAGLIRSRCEALLEQVERLRARMPEILQGLRQRLVERLSGLETEIDPQRLEQELVLLVQKMDIAEELDRLEGHVKEVLRVLEQKGAIGRRLDFLMQELNREANTIGSKSAHADTSAASVEMKVLIEQMREQVQNIE